MVYGNFPDGKVTEETACEPIGIYGALKLSGEKLVIAYNQVFQWYNDGNGVPRPVAVRILN